MNKKTELPGANESPHVGDKYWGKGGRFVVVDGKRVPAPAPAAPPAPTSESTSKKGK